MRDAVTSRVIPPHNKKINNDNHYEQWLSFFLWKEIPDGYLRHWTPPAGSPPIWNPMKINREWKWKFKPPKVSGRLGLDRWHSINLMAVFDYFNWRLTPVGPRLGQNRFHYAKYSVRLPPFTTQRWIYAFHFTRQWKTCRPIVNYPPSLSAINRVRWVRWVRWVR